MTIIVASRTQMAADSLVADNGEVLYYTDKVFRIRDCLVGVSGDVNNTTKFLAWFRKECPADETGMTLDETHDFAGLVLTSKGKLLYYADCVEPDVLHDKYVAIGAGRSHAIAALDCGKTLSEAVKHAIRRCPGTCGGDIKVLSIVPKAKRTRAPRTPKTHAALSKAEPVSVAIQPTQGS